MEDETTYLIKLLTGDHQGAEVALGKESIWLGQSDDCDIVLSDALLLPKHLKIEGNASGYRLIPQPNAPVYVDGRLVTEPTSPEPFQYILLGSTLIAIGPDKTPWPNLSPNQAPAIVETVTDLPPTEIDVPASETDSIEPQSPICNGEPQNPEPEAPNPSDFSAEQSKKRTFKRFLIATLCMICVIVSTTFWLLHKRPINQTESLLQSIERILTQLNASHLVTVQTQGPIPTLTGCVATKEDKRRLLDALQPLLDNKQITVKLTSQDYLLSAIQDFLSSIKAPLTVTTDSATASFMVGGYLADSEQVEKFPARLKEEVPGLKDIHFNLMTADDVFVQASEIIKKHHLESLISVITLSTGLLIQGSIGQQLLPQWETAKQTLTTTFSSIFPLIFRVQLVKSEELKPVEVKKKNIFFDSAIESITISEDGFSRIDLQNGKRYFEKSILPSGYVISKIKRNTILLSKGTETIELHISEL